MSRTALKKQHEVMSAVISPHEIYPDYQSKNIVLRLFVSEDVRKQFK
jgi:hypothetical protein